MTTEKQIADRRMAVLAMEFLARQINDEDIFEDWLMAGVADGDIEYGDFNTCSVDDYYIEVDNFHDLMGLFLRCMR